jgi:hypothetical protein
MRSVRLQGESGPGDMVVQVSRLGLLSDPSQHVSLHPVRFSSRNVVLFEKAATEEPTWSTAEIAHFCVILTRRHITSDIGLFNSVVARFSGPAGTGPGTLTSLLHIPGGGGVKRPKLAFNHPSHSNEEVKERVELHLYPPSVPSWRDIGRISPLPL